MNEMMLKGSTALVTGGAKRLGRAIALRLSAEGANVVVHYNSSPDAADALVDEIKTGGTDAWSIRADFSNPDEYESLIERATEIAGHPDILVNNASIFSTGTIDGMTLEKLNRNIEVNAWVPLVLSRDFARIAEKGKIVNILDTRVTDIDNAHPEYILSKKMLGEVTRMTAIEFAPDITVNAVAPGLILPPPGKDLSYLENLAPSIPLKRHGGPDDITDAVLFLLKSEFITGQVINVDGGRHLEEYKHG